MYWWPACLATIAVYLDQLLSGRACRWNEVSATTGPCATHLLARAPASVLSRDGDRNDRRNPGGRGRGMMRGDRSEGPGPKDGGFKVRARLEPA